MFVFNPDLASGDMYEEGDEAFDSYAREEEEDENLNVSWNVFDIHLIHLT